MEFLVGIEETDKMLLLQFIVFRILELTLYCGVQLIDTRRHHHDNLANVILDPPEIDVMPEILRGVTVLDITFELFLVSHHIVIGNKIAKAECL